MDNNDLPNVSLHKNFAGKFEEIDIMFNARDWLQKTIESNGAIVTGKGCGMGSCDLDFTLEGGKFNVSIKAL